ncbi:hypothetical protein [Nocardioides montaniterrae]
MAVTIDVDYKVLEQAKAGWDSINDTLEAAQLRFGKVTGHGLSAAVAAEVLAFKKYWYAEVSRLAQDAWSNADAFQCTMVGFTISDEQQAEKIRSLLPWADRGARIRTI